ncbi:MAG TPA: serine/threonine-protein kinase, partial [Gemmatimonas sp.]|nr:serine/threonine-protein kinase [Gemmatimonas sp.]
MSDLLTALRLALGDRFRTERELPGGGMSRVFVAEELALGRRVVLKVLPPDAAATVNADRFRREVQFAARLQHPHVVPVLSTGEDAGTLWYAMPYIQGDTLRARLATGAFDVREVVTSWQQMLDALAHAHRAGIVHRDMKPENVMVNGRHVLVTDFGIAKAVASATESAAASGLTGTGFVIGTPAYMAPEQATGMEQIDARADIYSTALIAYEMLTGKAAFGGMTPPQTLAAQVQRLPPSPRTLRTSVSPELDALLMQCLAKDPADRPETAEAVLQALERIERGDGAPPHPSPLPARPGARRFALPATALITASVLLALWIKRDKGAASNVPRDLVVVASFTHEARDSSVARALSEAFRIDLQQSPRLRVAEPQLVRTTLQSMRLDPKATITDSIAQILGVRVGAKAFVTGALSSLGTGYVITARLVSVKDGNEVAALRETAVSASALLDATDRLSKALREKAGESVASLRASPALPAATTASLEALEHYAAGVNQMREGSQLAALAEYEKAVAIDSMFASAWSGIGTALANIGMRPGDRQRAAARAYALRAKLPELERLRIESRYHSARGEVNEEIASLRKIIEIEPASYAPLNNLGRLMLGRLQYAAAESLLKAAVRVQPASFTPVDMLYSLAIETGNDALLDSLRRAMPTGPSRTRYRVALNEYEQVHRANYAEYSRQLD